MTTSQQVLVAVGVCALVAVPAALRAPGAGLSDAALLFGALAGLLLFFAAATTTLILSRTAAARQAPRSLVWATTALILLGSQTLLGCELVLMAGDWGLGVAGTALLELVVSAAALATAALGVRGTGVRRPFLLGSAVVVGAAVARLVVELRVDLPAAPAGLAALFVSLAVAANVGTGIVIGQSFDLPDRWVRRLCTLLAAVGLATLTRNPGFELTPVATVLNAALAVLVAWVICMSLVVLTRAAISQQRRANALEGDLLHLSTSGRDEAERMHEIRSTVAGLRAADQLVNSADLDDATSLRLRSSLSTELARLERLVSRPAATVPGPRPRDVVDLDSTLGVLADTHQARGRNVEWRSSGVRLEGSADDVVVALNILLENSARHASGSHSTIEVAGDDSTVEIVVSDDGPGIAEDVRESLFDWGVSTDHARGDGIGLAMARRLVTEQGGSLDLLDDPRPGTAFSIKLPTARTSPENS
ncbi:MAG: sensor histidine kinase [Nocardioides sp.]|uniref:sensor histidine kinase n=1 Tax=Nocardioides sp. TaxID=35761 RepID=UPI003F0B20FF